MTQSERTMTAIVRGVVLLVLASLSASAGANPPDARSVLDAAVAAAKAVKGLRYEAVGEASGILALHIPKMTGTVVIIRQADSEWPKLRVDAEVSALDRQQPATKLELAHNGRIVTIADHAQRSYAAQNLPQGAALLARSLPLLIRELASTPPYERETAAETIEHLGVETLDGVECDVIRVAYGQNEGETRWHIARSDHLPRRVERLIAVSGNKTSLTTVLSGIEADPDVSDSIFRVAKPAGFSSAPPAAGRRDNLLPQGEEAPDFTLKDATGKEVSLKSLRGKIVYMDFWATWCGPCRMAMPAMQKLYEKYAGEPVAIYGINCRERRRADPVAFMKQQKITYPILLNGDRVAQAYRVSGIPAFYLIGPDGKVMASFAGYSAQAEHYVDQLIEQTLGQMKAAQGAAGTEAAPAGS